MKDRAVSSQVGMILVFGLVVVAISMVYSGSKPIVEGMITSSHETAFEQSLTLLHANLMKVAFDGVPVRVTEFRTYEGSVSVLNESYVSLNNTILHMGRIVYEGDVRKVVIENGGVFAVYGDNILVLHDPFVISRGNVTVFQIIQLKGVGSTAGKGVLRIRMENMGGGVFEATNKTLVIHSDLKDKWAEILESNNFNVTVSGDDVIATCNSDKLLVKYIIVKVELLR